MVAFGRFSSNSGWIVIVVNKVEAVGHSSSIRIKGKNQTGNKKQENNNNKTTKTKIK